MDGLAWLWHIGVGVGIGAGLSLATWTAALRSDRSGESSPADGASAVTSEARHMARTAPTRMG